MESLAVHVEVNPAGVLVNFGVVAAIGEDDAQSLEWRVQERLPDDLAVAEEIESISAPVIKLVNQPQCQRPDDLDRECGDEVTPDGLVGDPVPEQVSPQINEQQVNGGQENVFGVHRPVLFGGSGKATGFFVGSCTTGPAATCREWRWRAK